MKEFGNSILQKPTKMDFKKIQEALDRIDKSDFAYKTDKQLQSYEVLSLKYKEWCNGIQPSQLRKYNKQKSSLCKLNQELVKEIREKYNPYVYGKQKLAKEYEVSVSVIYRIIKRKIWK